MYFTCFSMGKLAKFKICGNVLVTNITSITLVRLAEF